MDSTLPLYRQLSSRLFLSALSFFLLLFAGFALYFLNEQELTALKYQQLPAIENHNQRQSLLIKNERLINDVIASKYAGQFNDNYQKLNDNLKAIATLSRNNRRLLAQLTGRLQLQAENVRRLTENYRRNIQLKDSVIIQLTLVTDSLSGLIAQQLIQQKALYRKLSQDTSAAQVMAVRAKALTNLVNSLDRNRGLYQSLIDGLVMFSQLDLQYDLIEFDYIQQKIQREINLWLASAAKVVIKDANKEALFEQVTILNTLLFSEQNTFAKWRGQLHRVNDFQAELVKQKAELTPLFDKTLVLPVLKSSNMGQLLSTWLARVNVVLPAKHYIWLIGAVFVLLGVIFISLLFSIRRKIKQFGLQSTTVVQELVTKGEVSAKIPALEVTTIINDIKQLARPAHSEIDFQQQQLQHQKDTALMSAHSGYVFWQWPTPSMQNNQQLSALLGVGLTNLYWRQCFSKRDVLALLSIARQAKNNNSVERITVISRQKKALALTVEYIDGMWCGSVCDAEKYRVLKDENSQLHQQLQQQNKTDKLSIVASSEDVTAMVSIAMLQRQMLSLARGNERSAYLTLQQLLSWSGQQKTRAQLRLDDFALTLSTVNFTDEMHAALVNVSLKHADTNNRIYLHLGASLAAMVTLESELFQALINTICQKMLTEQCDAELDVELQVIDVNSAQQMVRMSFLLKKPSCPQQLMQVLDELALEDESSSGVHHQVDHYLRDLALVFNVSNKASQQLDAAGKFSFELPLAIAEGLNQSNKSKSRALAKCAVLVIATDKSNRERICQQLANSKAVVETMQDLSLFRRQISIKHLTKNRLDVIILSSEVYSSDYDLITQHLAGLPTKMQPKILVIQPFNCAALPRTGFFSTSNLPWLHDEIVDNVVELLAANNKINLLVEPEVFSPYRFVPSQVEVLLGVTAPSKNQFLIRVLHWLGLQVTVVSRQECLERLWQSGRYLVVITEFLPGKVDIGDAFAIVRGIFSLSHEASQKAAFSKLVLPKSWYSDCLAPALDIQTLTQQLSPWLKSVPCMVEHNKPSVLRPQQGSKDENIKQTQLADNVDVGSEPLAEIVAVDQALDFTLNLEQQDKSPHQAFDLTQFAQNQGSAELAVFMLDEYLADINVNALALADALEQHDYPLAVQILPILIQRAKVISATPLLAQCLALSKLLSEKADNESFSSPQKDELLPQLKHLKLSLVELTEFAESI